MSRALPLQATPAAGGRPRTFAAPRLDPQAAAFAVSNLIAILLALFVAFSLDLSRPLWAMLTAFFVAQPHSGSVRSRALYRFLGTFVGAAFSVLVTPALSPAPELLCLALAVWLGACLFLSLLDRSARAYVPMLAGYTATIIVFPSVEAPGQIFDTALARVEEISVGVACASLAHAIFWPREVSAALNRRIAKALGDADRWLADVLKGSDRPADRGRLAADVTELELLSHHLGFDTARLRLRRRSVRALLDELSALTPLVADLEDRLRLLRRDGALDPRLERLAAEVETWLRAGRATSQTPDPAAVGFLAQAETLEAGFLAGLPDWRGLVHASAAGRLADVLAIVEDARERADRLPSGGEPQSPLRISAPVRTILAGGPRRPLHRDPGLAALSGLVSAVALLGACALWIFTAWPEGGAAATFAGIGCCLFATQDDPTPAVVTFGVNLAAGIVLSAIYLFLILPQVDGFVLLGAVLAPAILVISYLQGLPAHNLRGLALAAGFSSGVGLQSRYGADLAAFLNGDAALLLGLVFAFAVQRLVRVIEAERSGRRIARRGRRQVAALARASAPADRGAWLSRGLDRLGLVDARLPRDGGAAEALTDLRVGLDVIDLQRLRQAAPPDLRQQLDSILDGVAMTFADDAAIGPVALAPAIDRALAACAAEPEGEPRRLGLAALVGLRRSLSAPDPDRVREAA